MPKQHIDTIPLWEAYQQESECPLCAIERKIEAQFLDVALGGALMEPETRIATNTAGFCGDHLKMLYARENKLGFALMLDTHLRDVLEGTQKQVEALQKELDAQKKKPAVKLAAEDLVKKASVYKQTDALIDLLQKRADSCYICDRINGTMERYIETLFVLYKTDAEFRTAFEKSKGVCLKHYPVLLTGAKNHLSGEARLSFLSTLLSLQNENLSRMEQELEWFTLKFDYRNKDKPWNNSKDAVERTLNKLRGNVIVQDEKEQK